MSDRAEIRVVHAEFEAGASTASALPDGAAPEVAFVGKSNVGKSSLMNALVQRKSLVRTSSTPGCTRQLNLFAVTLLDGRALRLVDLPGYGYARLSKAERASWGDTMEDYVRRRGALRCVVLIVDVRRGWSEEDAQMAEFLAAPRPPWPAPETVLVATKLDKIEKSKRAPALRAIARAASRPVLGFSAESGEGRVPLWNAISAALAGEERVG